MTGFNRPRPRARARRKPFETPIVYYPARCVRIAEIHYIPWRASMNRARGRARLIVGLGKW
jgi:hypothetical protein